LQLQNDALNRESDTRRRRCHSARKLARAFAWSVEPPLHTFDAASRHHRHRSSAHLVVAEVPPHCRRRHILVQRHHDIALELHRIWGVGAGHLAPPQRWGPSSSQPKTPPSSSRGAPPRGRKRGPKGAAPTSPSAPPVAEQLSSPPHSRPRLADPTSGTLDPPT
jgi:hypothetical protein